MKWLVFIHSSLISINYFKPLFETLCAKEKECMGAILKSFIGSHLFLLAAILLLFNGSEGLLLLPIVIFWSLFELSLITALINQLLLNEEKKGSVTLWFIVILTVLILFTQMTN